MKHWRTWRAHISAKARSCSVLILPVVNEPTPNFLDHYLHLDQDMLLWTVKCVQISTKAGLWSGLPPNFNYLFLLPPQTPK